MAQRQQRIAHANCLFTRGHDGSNWRMRYAATKLRIPTRLALDRQQREQQRQRQRTRPLDGGTQDASWEGSSVDADVHPQSWRDAGHEVTSQGAICSGRGACKGRDCLERGSAGHTLSSTTETRRNELGRKGCRSRGRVLTAHHGWMGVWEGGMKIWCRSCGYAPVSRSAALCILFSSAANMSREKTIARRRSENPRDPSSRSLLPPSIFHATCAYARVIRHTVCTHVHPESKQMPAADSIVIPGVLPRCFLSSHLTTPSPVASL